MTAIGLANYIPVEQVIIWIHTDGRASNWSPRAFRDVAEAYAALQAQQPPE